VLAERPLTQGSLQQHQVARYYTLFEEVVLQALPQGFFQCLVLLRMARAGEATSWVQWASIGGALVAVGYIGAELEHNIDMDPNDRKRMPQLHGYLPADQKRRCAAVLTGVLMYLSGFLATKVNTRLPSLFISTPFSPTSSSFHPPHQVGRRVRAGVRERPRSDGLDRRRVFAFCSSSIQRRG
jgi:hypothetical protein